MDEDIRQIIDSDFKNIYNDLNIRWQVDFKKQIIDLNEKGLINSGIGQKELMKFAINLIKNTNIQIRELLVSCQGKYNFIMSDSDISDYLNKCTKNNVNYLEIFQRDLSDYYKSRAVQLTESFLVEFNNAKHENKKELDKIKKELIIISKRENKLRNSNKKKEYGNLILTIISAMAASISAFLGFVTWYMSK